MNTYIPEFCRAASDLAATMADLWSGSARREPNEKAATLRRSTQNEPKYLNYFTATNEKMYRKKANTRSHRFCPFVLYLTRLADIVVGSHCCFKSISRVRHRCFFYIRILATRASFGASQVGKTAVAVKNGDLKSPARRPS